MKLVVILVACLVAVLVTETVANAVVSKKKSEGELAAAHQENGHKHGDHKQAIKTVTKLAHNEEKSKKGENFKEIHKKDDEEKGGKKKVHYSEGAHKSGKKSGGGSEHGAKFLEAAKFKKGNYKKGYREKYHKDEHKKHDSFYNNDHKSGTFEVFGKKHSKYNKHVSAQKQLEKMNKAAKSNVYKKAAVKAGGHSKADDKGHKAEKATKSHHNHQQKYAKKSSKKGGKQYVYKVPPK